MQRLRRSPAAGFAFKVYDRDIQWDMSRSAFPLPGEESIFGVAAKRARQDSNL
jgi:hypothetical protein